MSWEKVKLGDIATFINGYPFKPSDWCDTGKEIIRIQNLTRSSSSSNYYDGIIPEKYLVVKGDLLISWSATLGIYEWNGEDSWLNQHIFKVKFDKLIVDKLFFKYLIISKLNELESHVHGATMKHITKGKFDNIDVHLPPLHIQQHIADVLDKADALRQKDQQLLQQYDELAQSIFYDMFGDPVKNEKGWEVKKLKDCTSKIGSGSTPTGGKIAYKETGITLIRSMNVYDHSFKMKDLAFIDNAQANKLKNVEVFKNDVLFNITGASVCRCTIVPEELLPARVNQHVSIIRTKNNILKPTFLNYLLVSDRMKQKLLDVGSYGGAVMEAITKEQLEELVIVVPPIKLQDIFHEAIQFKNRLVNKTKMSESTNLFNSLLIQYFN